MLLKKGYVLRNIADQYIVVPVGERVNDLHGMLVLNKTAAFLWELMESEQSLSFIVNALTAKYDISADEAQKETQEFINQLKEYNLLESDNVL